MLSVGSRGDGRRPVAGLQFGEEEVEMEENELEEGEAYSGKEEGEDDDAPIDPDVALSYLDEKVQNVLGHFQKDFEGGVCAENLGAKFGGYGSFLPTYQRSPSILSQARSPHVPGNANGVNSTYSAISEVSPQNNNIIPSQTSDNKPIVPYTSNNLSNKDAHRKGSNNLEITPQHDSFSRSSNGSDQRTLKVRIKVGPESTLPRNNAAIYSRLGIDMSPSLSPEDSPEGSGGLVPKGHDSPNTPLTTFKFYSVLHVPHLVTCLLSPLHENLLFVDEKKLPIQKHFKTEDTVLLRVDKNYTKSRNNNDKGSRFSDMDSNTKSGGNHVSAAVNHLDAKNSPKKERAVYTSSPSLPPPPKYDNKNLPRQPVSERSNDPLVCRRPEKIVVKEEKPSPGPGRVDKEPPGISKFANGSAVSLKHKLSIEPSSDDKGLPNGSSNYGSYRDPQNITKPNDARSSDIMKTESDGYTEANDLVVGPAESVKLRAPQRTISYEEVGDLQEKDISTVKKKKIKGSKSSNRHSKDKFKDYSDPTSTAPPKDRKGNSAQSGEMDSKLNVSKSEKDSKRKVSKESTSYTPTIKVEHGDHRSKLGDVRPDYESGSVMPGDRMKERMMQKKAVNPLLSQTEKGTEAAPVVVSELAADVPPPCKDCWVQCDKCQKWRLCPPGVTPDDLPDNWLCRMLDWLPGMNKCSFSEEETTNALRARYQQLLPESQIAIDYLHYAAPTGITSASQYPRLNQDLAKANAKGKKTSDVNQNLLEPNQQNRCNLQHEDDATYFYAVKQKHKNAEKKEWQDQYSKKGDSVEKGSKSMKSKTRKEFDQDGTRISKKLKSAESSDARHDWHSNLNLSGERNSGAISDHSPEISAKYHKDNSRRNKLQLSGEMVKVPYHATENCEAKEEYPLTSDNSKKRKVKQPHGGKDHSKADVGIEIQKESNETSVRKEKKPRASKFDIRELSESRLPVESERNKPMSGTPLPGNRDEFHLPDSHDKQQDADYAYQFSQRNANNGDNLKRDMGFSQTSTAATSSSSKISGSCRSKTNFQEARGSPVESVSSSPLRTSATGKLTRRMDDTRNIDTFPKGSTGEYFSDIDGAYHLKHRASSAVHGGLSDCGRVPESRVVNPLNGTSNLAGKKTGPLTESKAQNILLSIFGHTDDEHSSEYEDTNVGVSAAVTSEPPHNISGEFQVRSHGNDLKLPNDFRPNERNPQTVFSNNSSRPKEKRRNPEVDVSDGKRRLPATASDQKDRNPTANDGMDINGRPIYTERPDKYNLEKVEKKTSSIKSSGEQQTKDVKKGNRPNSASGKYDVSGSALPADKHRGSNTGVAGIAVASGNREKSKHNEKVQEAISTEGRGAPGQSHDRMDRLDKSSGKSKKLEASLPLANRQDIRDIHQSGSITPNDSHPVPLPEKALTSTPASLPKEFSKPGSRNDTASNSLMQLTPNGLDATSSSKRDAGVSVTNVLKEATDLKHSANRKKNEGLDHESTGLCFQAALKFLYAASLMERSNTESSKHDPIQLYFQTAKLCEFCAHEYERRKEMAAAALAYKCTEVAYMKVVYLKNNHAMKDRHELHSAPQIGESPSSSASDVDNVNNQGIPDKMALDKKSSSLQGPQPAGGLVIAPRNRTSFLRILSFVEATNSAMEASKKSIHTLSLAGSTIIEEKKGAEGLSSVQRTLDFCFHDIEGLLRLVRLAMELINR